jgi:hypothetical protein
MGASRVEGRLPDGTRCPSCGSPLKRLHRHVVDRWVSLFRSMHRYHCTNPACGWTGLLGREWAATEAPPRAAVWRTRFVWFVAGACCTLAAVQGTRLYLRAQADAERARASVQEGVQAQSRATRPGEDFPGAPLPENDERVVQNPSPLNLRHSCSWGVPGSNPYRGTVEQALAAARLPPEVVHKISEMAEHGWTLGEVEISRASIRTVGGRREFGTEARAMAFGNTLCFNTRVNFKPGHVEYASLYEATDDHGQRYTVIVPHVCQNVAVLGEREEIPDSEVAVPAPATWTLLLLGLGALAWADQRRRRRS